MNIDYSLRSPTRRTRAFGNDDDDDDDDDDAEDEDGEV